MDASERAELTEQLENLLSHLIEVEANNYQLTPKQYDGIFRCLHNLKGTLAMLGADQVVVDLLHENEDLFKGYEKTLKLNNIDFEVIYKSSLQLTDFLTLDKIPQDYQTIRKCSGCKIDPVHNMPEECRSEKLSVTEMNYKLEGMQMFSDLRKQACSKILYIDSNTKKSQIEEDFAQYKIHYDKLDCLKEIYKLGPAIRNYAVIIINNERASLPVSLALKVIHRVNKECQIILCGKDMEVKDVDDFADISFVWVGALKRDCFQRIKSLIAQTIVIDENGSQQPVFALDKA